MDSRFDLEAWNMCTIINYMRNDLNFTSEESDKFISLCNKNAASHNVTKLELYKSVVDMFGKYSNTQMKNFILSQLNQ